MLFYGLYEAQSLYDVSLHLSDDTEVKCHKEILKDKTNLITADQIENKEYLDICLEPIYEPDVIRKLMDFVYKGETIVPGESAVSFFDAAEQLGVTAISDHEDFRQFIQNEKNKVIAMRYNAQTNSSENLNFGMQVNQFPEIDDRPAGGGKAQKKKFKNYTEEQMMIAVEEILAGELTPTQADKERGIPKRTIHRRLKKVRLERVMRTIIKNCKMINQQKAGKIED